MYNLRKLIKLSLLDAKDEKLETLIDELEDMQMNDDVTSRIILILNYLLHKHKDELISWQGWKFLDETLQIYRDGMRVSYKVAYHNVTFVSYIYKFYLIDENEQETETFLIYRTYEPSDTAKLQSDLQEHINEMENKLKYTGMLYYRNGKEAYKTYTQKLSTKEQLYIIRDKNGNAIFTTVIAGNGKSYIKELKKQFETYLKQKNLTEKMEEMLKAKSERIFQQDEQIKQLKSEIDHLSKQQGYCSSQAKLEKKLKEQSSEIIKQREQIDLLKTHVVRIFELLEFYGM